MSEQKNTILTRTDNRSYFIRIHTKSPAADKIFRENPQYNDKHVYILQIMPIEDNYLLIELINN